MSRGRLHRDDYRADLTERIPALYGEHGYIDLEVLGDTIVVDTLTGKGRIQVRLDEGQQYLVKSFVIDGNRRLSGIAIRRVLPTGKGRRTGPGNGWHRGISPPSMKRPSSRRRWTSQTCIETRAIFRFRSCRMWSEIHLTARAPTPPSTSACRSLNETRPISEPCRSCGNDYTHDRVIRKILLTLPGDILFPTTPDPERQKHPVPGFLRDPASGRGDPDQPQGRW